MAVIWQRRYKGVLYEVRSAGRSRRLYSNGVCHTQYHPEHILSGSVWDLLALPALFQGEENVKRVLVLGLGGGAVVHMLRHIVSPSLIVAVELNPIHIKVAKRFFGLAGKSVNLVEGDAITWLASYRGQPFDLIIDDLFAHEDGIPRRAVEANRHWIQQLSKHLRPDGGLIMNFGDRQELRGSVIGGNKAPVQRFASKMVLTHPSLDNQVVYCAYDQYKPRALRNLIGKHTLLGKPSFSKRLNFNIRLAWW